MWLILMSDVNMGALTARFMKRFTGHREPWGDFVDVKTNAPDLLNIIAVQNNLKLDITP